MKKKAFLIVSLLVVFVLAFLLIKDPKQDNIVNLPPQSEESIEETKCAKAGEEPVSNFDLTTGKTDPNIEAISCCEGLKEIEKKQNFNISADGGENKVCASIEGIHNTICSPCGNGICESEYEDYCNCPIDCD